MVATPDMTTHHNALQAICARCRSHTRVHYVYTDGDKLYADIVTELEDPRALLPRFFKVGYNVVNIASMGGDHFKYEMTVKS